MQKTRIVTPPTLFMPLWKFPFGNRVCTITQNPLRYFSETRYKYIALLGNVLRTGIVTQPIFLQNYAPYEFRYRNHVCSITPKPFVLFLWNYVQKIKHLRRCAENKYHDSIYILWKFASLLILVQKSCPINSSGIFWDIFSKLRTNI